MAEGVEWWKGVLLYAIAPALVSTMFPIAYSELSKPRIVLTYSTLNSPPVSGTDINYITSVRFVNKGTEPLHKIRILINPSGSKIASASGPDSRLKGTISSDKSSYEFDQDVLFPQESGQVALLLAEGFPGKEKIDVFSDEVNGQVENDGEKSNRREFFGLPNSLMFGAVYLTAILASLVYRRRFRLRFSVPYSENVILFIASIFGLTRLQDILWSVANANSRGMTFFGAADLVVADGILRDQNEKRRYILALECLAIACDNKYELANLFDAFRALDKDYDHHKFEALSQKAKATWKLPAIKEIILDHIHSEDGSEQNKFKTARKSIKIHPLKGA